MPNFFYNQMKIKYQMKLHMIEIVKMNFKNEYKPNFICNSCNLSECNQSHLLYCSALIGKHSLITYIPNYEDIFDDDDPTEKKFIAHIMMEKFMMKKKIEEII